MLAGQVLFRIGAGLHTAPARVGTPFQRAVWDMLSQIPYGITRTYCDIAGELAWAWGMAQMVSQAVGGAVGRNPVSILVPCHRMVGTGGSLVEYGGGLERKLALLRLEGVNTENLFVPQSGAAP